MNKQIAIKTDELRAMTPVQMVEAEAVAGRFVDLYDKIHGKGMGETFYAKEKFNFLRLISENEQIRQCTQLSLYGAFLDIAVNGLTMEQGSRPMVYIIPRNAKVGEGWEKRANLIISPYGELYLRMKAGHIRHVDNPTVVYEGDTFRPGEKDGKKFVDYQPAIPRKSSKIIGGFIKFTRADGSTDYFWMLQGDIDRLKGYSARQNGQRGANALYTSYEGQIDPGFLEAKLIRHAFKTCPRLRTGSFTALETEVIEERPGDIYGLQDENGNAIDISGHQAEQVEHGDQDGAGPGHFAGPDPNSEPVVTVATKEEGEVF